MTRIGRLIGFLAVAGPGFCATRSLPIGDAERGGEVFRAWRCAVCHSIHGEGGKTAPDLGKIGDRGFSPYRLTGLVWNHAPVMWAAMERAGIARPQPTGQESADLFALFFAAGYFEDPGNARRGRLVFRSEHCAECHGIQTPLREGIPPVAAWKALEDPISLAQQMWNHSLEMRQALNRGQVPYPKLSSRELADVLVYLRGVAGARLRAAEFSPASAETGQVLFTSKGCAECHRGSLSLENRHTGYGPTDFAAAMWNHASQTAQIPAPLSYPEMRRLVGYLISTQFFEERGNPERGELVFARKRCGACHDNPSSGAPARATLAGRMTSFDMLAALWKHGPAMLERMRQEGLPWPHFVGAEMADLTAYLHGPEFKQRPGAGAR
ncbi:MAG: c-type cytochrome [Bryobacteraceae bacterium]